MKSKWIALSSLSFGIGFCLSIPINRNIEKSLLTGLSASASTVASASILSKLNKIDEYIYKSRQDLSEKNKDLELQIEHLQNKKASAGESLAVVVDQLDKKNEVYSQLSNRYTKLESDKEDLESLISQYSSELEDISLLIEDKNDEVDQLNQSKPVIERILEDLHKQQASYEQRIEDQKHALSQLETEVSSLEEQRSRLLTTSEALNNEIKGIEQNKTELNSSISDLELRKSQIIAEENSLNKRIIDLGSKTKRKEYEIDKLESEINELNQTKNLQKTRSEIYLSLEHLYLDNTEFDIRQTAIQKICKERNIDTCTHLTRIENLPSILTNGLIPRKYLEKINIDYLSVNSERREDYIDANCLNISFPHHAPVLSASEKTKKCWVSISYKKDILWRLDCAFCFTNASSEEMLAIPIDDRKTEESFEKIFTGNDHLPKNYPTDSQAAVLVFDIIPSFYLKKVTFYDDEVRDQWMKDNPIFSFNDRLFSHRDQIRIGCESPKEVNKHN